MRSFSVSLDRLPPRERRPNSRAPWQAKMKPAAAEREAGQFHARANWDGEPMDCAELIVAVRHTRRLDLDNVLASLKPFIDGLIDGGVVVDDGPDAIAVMTIQWQGIGKTKIVVQLREISV